MFFFLIMQQLCLQQSQKNFLIIENFLSRYMLKFEEFTPFLKMYLLHVMQNIVITIRKFYTKILYYFNHVNIFYSSIPCTNRIFALEYYYNKSCSQIAQRHGWNWRCLDFDVISRSHMLRNSIVNKIVGAELRRTISRRR